MTSFTPITLADGFGYLEGPRWHDGELWMSDMVIRKVFTLDSDGNAEDIIEVPGKPSGIGFLPNGTPLIVSMNDHRLYRLESDGLAQHAALGAFMTGSANDMVVDDQGRAYVGNFGFDLYADDELQPANIVMVTPGGEAQVVASDLSFPNGAVILRERRMLVVAEQLAGKLTAYDIEDDGTLSNRRVFADLGGQRPDGICLDVEGGIWVASFKDDVFLRVLEGGQITDRVDVPGRRAVACQLGGDDGCTLFCLTYEGEWYEVHAEKRAARVEIANVKVAGAGSP